MPKRQRSDSASEEKAISAYVDSCTKYRSNLRFTDIASVAGVAAHVLLVGTPDQLKDKSVHSLKFYCPAVAEAIGRIQEGKTIHVLASVGDAASFTSVSISATPTTASRTNCPFRPDTVAAAVSAAAGLISGKGEHTLDVYIRAPAGAERAMANAIARGSPHSYSAKDGYSAKAYLKQNITINVVFSSRCAFTGEKVNGSTITVAELEDISASVQLCQRLVDTPTNTLDTVVFAEIATAYAAELGADICIIKGEDLREQGYGGIYAVGKGAQYPPHLVTLRYRNTDVAAGAKNVSLVGKGIVYDCGGLAIKPAAFMCNMKTDMGGAAAVFCGFIATVRAMRAKHPQYKHIANISVTLCLAENAIGPDAFRNDDIIIMKSGKSVEVKNTDAEGRIVLGDGVFFATNEQDFIPDVLVDMATLTGAQGIATGTKHAAIFVNEAEAEEAVLQAGRRCGDTCFPVLYCPEYHTPQYATPCADMRNIMETGADGGVSCAGHFVASHVSERFKGAHVHVDLAFPSFDKVGGTGFGVTLLSEYLKK